MAQMVMRLAWKAKRPGTGKNNLRSMNQALLSAVTPMGEEMSEREGAGQLLAYLRQHILAGGDVIAGYDNLARVLGFTDEPDKDRGSVVQLCSRLDLACFKSHLPMLALHWVRGEGGIVNLHAFSHPAWQDFEHEMRYVAAAHRWSQAQFNRLQAALDKLPDECAKTLWEREEREADVLGAHTYIRYNLHRHVRNY